MILQRVTLDLIRKTGSKMKLLDVDQSSPCVTEYLNVAGVKTIWSGGLDCSVRRGADVSDMRTGRLVELSMAQPALSQPINALLLHSSCMEAEPAMCHMERAP